MSGSTPASSRLDSSTVGSLLAGIATALQDTLRTLLFADKRGWGPDEFEQVRAVEEALDEAKRDFQAIGPLVNGQFYYENDRRAESLAELVALRNQFADHTQLFRDWIRSGGPINPLWVRETVHLRRQLHRAQCRAACRIFKALHEFGDSSSSGARCLGAFLVYRRLRKQTELQKLQSKAKAHTHARSENPERNTGNEAAISRFPTRRQQQSNPQTREQRQFVDQRHFPVHTDYNDNGNHEAHTDETISLEMTLQNAHPQQSTHTTRPLFKPISKAPATAPQLAHQSSPHMPRTTPQQSATRNAFPHPIHLPISSSTHAPISTAPTSPFEPARTTIPLHPDEPPSPPPRLPSLEDLVPYCNAVGTFERFGDRDIAFICDYCDGHIIWEDIQRLPTTRAPPIVATASSSRSFSSSSSSPSPYLPSPVSAPLPSSTLRRSSPQVSSAATQSTTCESLDNENGEYPRWQASTVAMSDASKPRTVIFAPLAIANHLAPMAGDWEARLWCPYCDTYLYYDSSEGDQTKYAQDEHGFPTLTDFQLHLEWHHTGLPKPALPSASSSCSVM
ncbi:hypothetical protein SEPCBS57363_002887 [Sporothrix epigloea]|uniref:Uncharacterized protein n=1 Tax=Sporothrix epigloea TaxID=1892477 RepID=A0ABP0DLR2_9PEZI